MREQQEQMQQEERQQQALLQQRLQQQQQQQQQQLLQQQQQQQLQQQSQKQLQQQQQQQQQQQHQLLQQQQQQQMQQQLKSQQQQQQQQQRALQEQQRLQQLQQLQAQQRFLQQQQQQQWCQPGPFAQALPAAVPSLLMQQQQQQQQQLLHAKQQQLALIQQFKFFCKHNVRDPEELAQIKSLDADPQQLLNNALYWRDHSPAYAPWQRTLAAAEQANKFGRYTYEEAVQQQIQQQLHQQLLQQHKKRQQEQQQEQHRLLKQQQQQQQQSDTSTADRCARTAVLQQLYSAAVRVFVFEGGQQRLQQLQASQRTPAEKRSLEDSVLEAVRAGHAAVQYIDTCGQLSAGQQAPPVEALDWLEATAQQLQQCMQATADVLPATATAAPTTAAAAAAAAAATTTKTEASAARTGETGVSVFYVCTMLSVTSSYFNLRTQSVVSIKSA
jgi:hypothetical protein